MLKMIQSIKFRKINNPFLLKLKNDINRIENESKLLIPADKTTNIYKLETPVYSELLERNITKSYKKSQQTTIQTIQAIDNAITSKLGIDNRVDITAKKEAFMTLKDYKPNFENRPTCRLINPTKSEIGQISKKILDRINKKILSSTNINQWKNTKSVIDWFRNIKNKQQHSFICFDIVDFYPSISQNLLSSALHFASNLDDITSDEKDIIMHAKTSFIIHKDQPWEKKGASNFDVTMGSYDGAETCELVGSFLLSQLPKELEHNIGLYRDDGLAITNSTSRATERIKQSICHIFKQNGLRITIEANKHVINFLDVTFNLTKNTYQPYTKPNTTLQYVHNESNHLPLVIRNIPAGINKRLSSLSSNKACFDQAAPLYQKALRDCGYQHKLLYEPTEPTKKKNRKRNNILWYNPPYSKNVTNNIGHIFLTLIKKHFPTGNKLRKIFNHNTVKISYSCMSNTRQISTTIINACCNTTLKTHSQPTTQSNSRPTLQTKTRHATANRKINAPSTETAYNRH